MTAKYYTDEILNGIVKPWLERGDNFVLEEDHDSSHGIAKGGKGLPQEWKRLNRLNHYFNCTGSLDLAPIENAWQPIKQNVKKYPYLTQEEIKEIASETWYDQIRQKDINKWCLSMPERLQQVIDLEGKITSY